eukprot:TRINITY_DN15841_c0_g1_i1.p1 TRINITY_DN15841_c0_g1~~TRINITY_DN15841_c0_g1_i1.p1  ORF type:complete len:1117 (+),score=231.56 TRINITY_DN15841_c0_g1_i1:73-3423(+)
MSLKAIRERDGKHILTKHLASYSDGNVVLNNKFAAITPETNLETLPDTHPWLLTSPLVAKPDQLIKRRGKGNLLLLNADWEAAKAWIAERRGKEVQVEAVKGPLTHFLVEPFVPHAQSDEYYLCIYSDKSGDHILFHHEGGVDVGDVDAKALTAVVPIDGTLTDAQVAALLVHIPETRRPLLQGFVHALFKLYVHLHFGYCEINPLVVVADPARPGVEHIVPLDLAAKLDQTAAYEVGDKWDSPSFPAPFGRASAPEEDYIAELDSKTGASLKLSILNPKGRIWTMVAGGGASVIYTDTISDLGAADDLANYGEYSGAPSEAMTYQYARTILDLMTRFPDPRGKILIIGGAIANFTNVAATFKGITRALTDFKDKLQACNTRIYVRRAGPNYQEGLQMMRDLSPVIKVPIEVYGPETHLTSIVSMALGKHNADFAAPSGMVRNSSFSGVDTENYTAGMFRTTSGTNLSAATNASAPVQQVEERLQSGDDVPHLVPSEEAGSIRTKPQYSLFNEQTRALVYGMQPRAVQGMLDFDYVCKRKVPSVAAIIYSFSGNHFQKFYYGTSEILIPVYQTVAQALQKYPEVDTVVNFSSFRSVYESMQEILSHPSIKCVSIIAEGVPERRTLQINNRAHKQGVTIIGPATVGGVKPGCFRIGNTGGMLDNIMASKLYRPGNVAYVSRSGGMSNELNNIISRTTNGVYEGVAVGGDRYPGSSFIDHLLRYEANPEVKMLVLLGELGGIDEYDVVQALQEKKITKPIVAWCIGTCAKMFAYEVQFGHAGAQARGGMETADAKNNALRSAGAIVPPNFDEFGNTIRKTYVKLVEEGVIVEEAEPEPPKVPIDYDWAQELGLIRKPSAFVSSICDDRGEELLYAGMPITNVFKEDIGVGGVLSLLWFRRRLPAYACKYIEMIMMVTADHGPAVSGAHNTIVTTRAGKDLVSALCSGLLTIGPRFGGAIDGAAEMFSGAFDKGFSAKQFVEKMRLEHKLILGIGHRVKSLTNPDMRVEILKEFARTHFPSTDLLNFACEVEQVTTQKRSNLILNVDGCVAATFVDLLRTCGAFTREEADEYVKLGVLNGLFVLGRTIGFIGHFLDQKRLKQGLYRHPWDDITYINDFY